MPRTPREADRRSLAQRAVGEPPAEHQRQREEAERHQRSQISRQAAGASRLSSEAGSISQAISAEPQLLATT